MTDQPVPKTISATTASNHFGRMIDEAATGQHYFIVTRMGSPRAVVLGVEQYRDLMEQLETVQELHDPDYMAGIAEAREDIRLGRTLTLDELDAELGFTGDDLSRDTP